MNVSKRSDIPILYLTFDVEDHINVESMRNLYKILELLDKRRLKGVFFMTGEVAEKLINYPKICELLMRHIIGYHSNTHSRKPRIYEYTDIKDYYLAIRKAIKIETSHLDRETGKIEGKGGIYTLRRVFNNKKIIAFRAPQLCWTPPHLEALRKFGFKYDFSADICKHPVQHKGITFYPYPYWIDTIVERIADIRQRKPIRIKSILGILQEGCCILANHPDKFSVRSWDSLYFKNCNYYNSSEYFSYSHSKIRTLTNLKAFDFFLNLLKILERFKKIRVAQCLKESDTILDPNTINVKYIYDRSLSVPCRLLNFKPRYLWNHFQKFFSLD